ncbi:MAG: SdpI family protein [Sphingobacteriales bacterium]|nr:MAG: SdpI family protein [Sphingobacteriales bacterium]
MNAEHWIVGPQLIGIIFFTIGLLTKCFPSKHLNDWYGYRMPSSMESEEKWIEANCYASKLMVKMGALLVVAGLLLNWLISISNLSGQVRSGLLLLLIITSSTVSGLLLIILTEKHLERKFDKH